MKIIITKELNPQIRKRFREDPVAAYGRIREKHQATIQCQDDEKLRGYEGAVWYVTTANMEWVFLKCKIDGINKNRV